MEYSTVIEDADAAFKTTVNVAVPAVFDTVTSPTLICGTAVNVIVRYGRLPVERAVCARDCELDFHGSPYGSIGTVIVLVVSPTAKVSDPLRAV